MNMNGISSTQKDWSLSNQQTVSEDRKPLTNKEIKKEEEDKNSLPPALANQDQYIKSNGQPERSPGIYRLEKDENGNPKIVVDRPEKEEGGNKPKTENDPEKKVEVGKSVGDDSQWKAEIDKIKQKKSQLLQKISNARDDENKRKELEGQLALVEAELSLKDTDSYRKQRTVVRHLGSEMMDAADAANLN